MRLIESTTRVQVRPGWTLGSAFIHGSLIGMTVVMTMRVPADRAAPPEPVRLVYPTDPALRAGGRAAPGAISVPRHGITLPSIELPSIPRVDVDLPHHIGLSTAELLRALGSGAAPGGSGWGTTNGSDAGAGAVHAVSQVDRAVVPFVSNPRPDYPASLRAAAAEGEVVVRFVVDTTGVVEPGSIAILSATHELFADAVRRWLPRTRYVAAEAGGRRVRQLVQQRVAFDLLR